MRIVCTYHNVKGQLRSNDLPLFTLSISRPIQNIPMLSSPNPHFYKAALKIKHLFKELPFSFFHWSSSAADFFEITGCLENKVENR
jgi:hypothetical protein